MKWMIWVVLGLVFVGCHQSESKVQTLEREERVSSVVDKVETESATCYFMLTGDNYPALSCVPKCKK